MKAILLILLGCLTGSLRAQDTVNTNTYLHSRGEVVFRFIRPGSVSLRDLSRNISIDRISGDTVWAYANSREFEWFSKQGVPWDVLTPPSLIHKPYMEGLLKDSYAWDSYPTYGAYVSMMQSFAGSYPDICRLDTIGFSVKGRMLLAVKISDTVQREKARPRVFYSSTIHGDETTGYVLMLHLIDSLLTGYQSSAAIKKLVDSLEIWINPLANPDGTYASGDNTVYGATRGNANYVDMNRNFPDPEDGDHPDGNTWQEETVAMMNFMKAKHFSLSVNFHGGSEVVNYPWDTWVARHPDDTWFQLISQEYADTVHRYGSTGYFMDPYSSGITDGYDWYTISGGRQDYMTYFMRGREVTIELSNTKMPITSTLPAYWRYNFRSLFNYMACALHGISGTVTDSISGKPLKAMVSITGHDQSSAHSEVYSDSLTGFYVRLLAPGPWVLTFSADGYNTKVLPAVYLDGEHPLSLNVQLSEDTTQNREGNITAGDQICRVYPNPAGSFVKLVLADDIAGEIQLTITDLSGRTWKRMLLDVSDSCIVPLSGLPTGLFFMGIQSRQKTGRVMFVHIPD